MKRAIVSVMGMLVLFGGVTGSTAFGGYTATGPAVPIPGYSPNPTSDEIVYDVSSDGQYMHHFQASILLLLRHGVDPEVVLWKHVSHEGRRCEWAADAWDRDDAS